MKKGLKRLPLDLDEKVHYKFKEFALKRKIPMSEILRKLITRLLKGRIEL